jgi:hypothetical protein
MSGSGPVRTLVDAYGYPVAAAFTESLTATGAVKASPGRLASVLVTTALSAAAVTIYDNASAASGTVLAVIPASSAIGTRIVVDLPAFTGIYASFGGTGTVVFGYS